MPQPVDQQSDHAAGLLHVEMRHAGRGVEHFAWLDVTPHLACGSGCIEQRLQRGQEALLESIEEGSREVVRVAKFGPSDPTGTFTQRGGGIPW